MNELKQLEMQKDDEIEIDLGEIFHLLLNKLWIIILCFIVGATLAFGGTKTADHTEILRFLNDLYLNKDNKRDIPCRYSDGYTADCRFWNLGKEPSCSRRSQLKN